MKLEKVAIGVAVSCGVLCLLGASNAYADEQMHRMYNPNSGEHFYTANVAEKQHLESVGWKYEGIGWVAPTGDSRGDAVYRLYNRNSGDHHYTLSAVERDWLVKLGWAYEGIGWYSAKPEQGVPLYRLYNPYAKVGTHHYTLALSERDWLVTKGWKAEGIGWYAVKNSNGGNNGSTASKPIPTPSNDGSYIPDGVTQLGNSGKLFAWAKADEWSRKQIADKGSKWYGYNVVLKAVYKDDHLVGFSPDFSKATSGDSSTNNSDGSSTVPDGATKLGNSGKFFKQIDDANAWAEKQVKDASSKFYGKTYYPITVVKGSQPVGYSIEFNDAINNGGTNSGNSGTNTGSNTGTNTGSNTGSTFEFNESEVANEIIRLTNEERNKVGVPEIKANQVLMDYASMRAEEITRVYSHTRPNGEHTGDDLDKIYIDGHRHFVGGENITIVMSDKASSNKELALLLYTNWKNSPGHYLNLVNGNTNLIGVGVHKGLYSGKDAYYSCMDVGSYSE